MARRNLSFVLFGILCIATFRVPLITLVSFSFEYVHYSHILLIPLVSAYLIYLDRRKIFVNTQESVGSGTALLLVALATLWLAEEMSSLLSQNDYLSLTMFSMVIVWMAGFMFCYGKRPFWAAAFPLFFLFLMVPIPDFLLERIIHLLQVGSAEVAHRLFNLVGVPVFREGLLFSLPGINIEVAKECSGIRSSLALFITSLIAGHWFLRSARRKACLSLSILPLLVIKNGIRIVTISLLAIYVDRSFLTGNLHQSGGILFFGLAIVVLVLVVGLLRQSERKLPEDTPRGTERSSVADRKMARQV